MANFILMVLAAAIGSLCSLFVYFSVMTFTMEDSRD